MRLLNAVFAAALFSAVSFAPGAANAQRLDDAFSLEDLEDPNGNFALLAISGTNVLVEGAVRGVGTAGDLVQIIYGTDTPTHLNADENQARIRQRSFSTLLLLIESDTNARDLALTLNPQKCQIDGKVQADKERGDVTVKCSADDLFADVTADQLASIQAAFLDNKQVKIKANSDGSRGSVSIRLKGTATEAIET